MWKLKPRRKEQMDNLGCALMIVLVAVAALVFFFGRAH